MIKKFFEIISQEEIDLAISEGINNYGK